MLDIIQKKYAEYILKPYLSRYLQRPRMHKYKGLRIRIYPSVFHPKYFFSTSLLLEFMNTVSLKEKKFCEVGAGSGLISFVAFQKGADVTAIEYNQIAIKGLTENFESNFGKKENFRILFSDLFDNVPAQQFDILFINPPYFFKKISSETTMAWNCGENGEYFIKLFSSLRNFCHAHSEIYMVLADNCDINRISQIAAVSNFKMIPVLEKKIKWEKNFIFKLNFGDLAPSVTNK